MKKFLLAMVMMLPMIIAGCNEKQKLSQVEPSLPNNISGISLGISYDSVSNILSVNNWQSSIGTDMGSGFTVTVNSKIPYQNTFFERAYIYICQKHGVVGIVGVKQYDDYESAERCYNSLSDTISVLYKNYLSTDSLSDGIVRQTMFKENNIEFSVDIQESKRIIDIWPLVEADSWNVNVSLQKPCKDI